MIWLVAVPIIGLRLRVPGRVGQPTLEIGLPPVFVVALFASLAGWGLLALLERLTRRARGVWSVLALAVLLLSFAMLTGPGIAPVTRLVLGLMHVAVATVLIPSLWKAPTKGRTWPSP